MLLLNLVQCYKVIRCNHFNTSYVVIKRIQYPSIDDYDKYFNTSYVVIKLYCLIVVLKTTYNFNTSYVVIKQVTGINSSIQFSNFNTSYVVIKLGCNELPKSRDLTFQYILCCY